MPWSTLWPEKYDIPGLKVLARTRFSAAAAAEFNPRVSRKSPPDMAHLIAVISLVYNSTPGTDRGLRVLIVGNLWMHLKQLSPEPDFHALIAANPEMIIDVVTNRSGQHVPWGLDFECSLTKGWTTTHAIDGMQLRAAGG